VHGRRTTEEVDRWKKKFGEGDKPDEDRKKEKETKGARRKNNGEGRKNTKNTT